MVKIAHGHLTLAKPSYFIIFPQPIWLSLLLRSMGKVLIIAA